MTELQGTVESVEVAPVTATGKKVLNESSNTMKESTKPSLKSIFSSLLSEADQKERLDEVIFFSPAGLINSGMSAETALLSAFVVYAAGAAYMAFSPSFKYYRQDLINRFNDFRDSGKLDKGAIAELEKKAESIINSLPSSKKRMLNQLVKQLSSVKDDKSQLLKTIRRIESYIEKNKTELDEAEQVTIQPAKQNTQVIKQGQKTLGTVENPQLAQQIKQSIGKGEMSLAGDELQEDDMAEGLDPAQKQKLKSLIYAYRDATDPFGSEYDLDPSVVIDRIRQEFGDKIADTISQGPSMHYPRPGHVSGVYDPLANKSSPRVTKLGKINRQDAETMKRNIKQQQGMTESKLTEKATSKSQQQAAGAALAAKRGDAPKSKLTGASKEMAKMPAKELEKFAKTKHKGLPEKKKTDEAALPTNDSDFGAGLGAGRNSKTLEAKKAKPDFLDSDKDGNKKESMKKAAADKQKVSTMKNTTESKAKPDFLDSDKDGDKKESMKKAQADKKAGSPDKKSSAGLTAAQKKLPAGLQKAVAKKKTVSETSTDSNSKKYSSDDIKSMIAPDKWNQNTKFNKDSADKNKASYDKLKAADKKKTVKEGTNPTEAARLLGKAHAMGKDPFACKYEAGTPEAQAYLDGYKEGLDECYGSGGGMGMQQDIGMMPGMDSMVSQDSMMDSPSPRGGSEFAFGGFDEVSDDDMMAFESWDRELNALLNEGKMKDIDIDMKQMSDAQFKKEHGKSKADMKKDLSSDAKKPVKEGISVSVSKGQQGSPDSVTVSAQDQDADALLAMIKQAGLGLFGGDEPSGYGSPASAATQPIGDIGDQDSMMALIKKMSSTGNDYEDEESQDDQHAHGHPDAACDNCGSATCEGGSCSSSSKETMMGEDETEDQMEFEVSEANAPDSGESEESDEETTDATRDAALATAAGQNFANTDAPVNEEDEDDEDEDAAVRKEEAAEQRRKDRRYDEELNEWANDAGYEGSENTKDNTFEQDIEFMTRIISGGLNGPKKDQTTLPHTRVKVEESSLLNDWKKLSGIK